MQNLTETTPRYADADARWMAHALTMARSARGRVAPNPPVGAVVVRDGRMIAEGATQPPPGYHAEVVALTHSGLGARGADLYVTLEPCSHVGRTPPCTDAIIRSGIRRVVVALLDPFPLVNGSGIERLRAAGITVEVGVGAGEAAEVIAGFSTRIRTGRPLVTVKYAMTLDGRIATTTGHSRWISGTESREHAHTLRDQVDAILVGIGTVLADDPLLTTRLGADRAGYGGPHHPLRVVLDGTARTPPTSRMLAPETPGHTLIAVATDAPNERTARLEAAGAEVIGIERCDAGLDLPQLLQQLGARGINTLLVEGGGTVHGAFFDAQLVDRVSVYIAPTIVGGDAAPGPVGGCGVRTMHEAPRIIDEQVTKLGADLLLEGRVDYHGEPAHV